MRPRQLKPIEAHADPSRPYNGNGVPVITSLSTELDELRPIHLRGRVDGDERRLVVLHLTEAEALKVAADIVSLLEARKGLA